MEPEVAGFKGHMQRNWKIYAGVGVPSSLVVAGSVAGYIYRDEIKCYFLKRRLIKRIKSVFSEKDYGTSVHIKYKCFIDMFVRVNVRKGGAELLEEFLKLSDSDMIAELRSFLSVVGSLFEKDGKEIVNASFYSLLSGIAHFDSNGIGFDKSKFDPSTNFESLKAVFERAIDQVIEDLTDGELEDRLKNAGLEGKCKLADLIKFRDRKK